MLSNMIGCMVWMENISSVIRRHVSTEHRGHTEAKGQEGVSLSRCFVGSRVTDFLC